MAERYLWESFGGCARCEALAGLYDGEPPPRPHPECRCDVVRLQGDDEPLELQIMTPCYFVDVHDIRVPGPTDPPEPEGIDVVIYDFRVLCVDGTEHAGTIPVDIPKNLFKDPVTGEDTFFKGWNYGLMEVYEKIADRFESVCCPGAPLS